ncbi:MAG: bifunctional response regulator/alkaline phosphatase family protein [bacterium]|nr:bifunctional response regulator/alkaline phosphatase family protein [bacterium]
MYRLLWIDDEIELLRPHIYFLQERGYEVETASNPEDGIVRLKEQNFDAILLDQMMTGKSGLDILPTIRETKPNVPIVMVTQSEDEDLIEHAFALQVSDFLVKPIRGSQILAVLKRILESRELARTRSQQEYLSEFNRLQNLISPSNSFEEWFDLHNELTKWEITLIDELKADTAVQSTLEELRKQANVDFCKSIERNYRDVIREQDAIVMSPHIVAEYVVPHLEKNKAVAFIVIDCLRLDQWMAIEPFVRELFDVQRQLYLGILPTATPYARNSLFTGMFPIELEKTYSQLFSLEDEDDLSANRFEKEFLEVQLQHLGIKLQHELVYLKSSSPEDAVQLERRLSSFSSFQMSAFVFNFVDQVAHSRSAVAVMREMVPTESAYRDIVRNWYRHSQLPNLLEIFAKSGTVVVLTSDHGSTRGKRASKVMADKEASSGLRYKYGRNLKCDRKAALYIDRPEDFYLPKRGLNTTYLIAREDYFFVYPTNSNQYARMFQDSFQHGGISLEEQVLPIVTLLPKQ